MTAHLVVHAAWTAALGVAVVLVLLVALCTPRHPNSIRRRPDGRNIKRGSEE